MKTLLIFVLTVTLSFADIISPASVLKTDGAISDMVIHNNKIYASTDEGKITLFDLKTHRKLSTITLPKIKSSNTVSMTQKIYSLDAIDNSIVMVAESGGDFRSVYLYKNKKFSKIIDSTRGLMIKKVRFLDPDQIFLGLSGDTLVLFNIPNNTLVYQVQAGGGVFGDMELSPKKSLVAIGDESGEITMIATHSGKKVKTLRGINLDAINRLSYQKNTILSGGHDRRVGVYRKEGSYFLDTGFFVYAVGLSPSATKGAYTDGEENVIQIFDIPSQQKLFRLRAGDVIIDRLLFVDEHQLFGAGEENKIYYWRLP